MSHRLEALIAAPEVLAGVPGPVVPLGHGLAALPLLREVFDALGVPDPRAHADIRALTASVVDLAARLSSAGAVAFVETDYVGGPGQQAAMVWLDGAVVLGPLVTGDGVPTGDGAINRALRLLGVSADGSDEFDSLRLGRYRRTTDLLAELES